MAAREKRFARMNTMPAIKLDFIAVQDSTTIRKAASTDDILLRTSTVSTAVAVPADDDDDEKSEETAIREPLMKVVEEEHEPETDGTRQKIKINSRVNDADEHVRGEDNGEV